ncbi:MAG TPA: hypothetical protein PLN43_06690 [Anaerolineales bacterium]|nr:hypothetical protein [Anaerolineales bacterium]HMX18082.1 hypothetical protein [Anaerolineales bacterium]HMZ41864.1 hypothetical protein [Anaerolineales bacterium]HNB85459.1 hypothetical protein [Anaerolineales bacterium]HNC87314.1 hypothetical protein [Anaerolineales bacterium]
MHYISPDKEEQIRQIARSGNLIEAIKEYRLLTNASLKDAKSAVEAMVRGNYVNGPAPQAVANGADSSQKSQILDLMSKGREIEAIKLYRGWTKAGLKEAKDAVEAMARGEDVQIPEPVTSVESGSMDGQIRALLAKNQKIEAIKVHRAATNSSLKEAKDYVEAIERGVRPNPSSPLNIPLSNDPFEEENVRTRRMMVFVFIILAILAVVFAFAFLRGGL